MFLQVICIMLNENAEYMYVTAIFESKGQFINDILLI